MNTENNRLFRILQQLKIRVNDIEKYRYREKQVSDHLVTDQNQIIQIGDTFNGIDEYIRVRFDGLALPENWHDKLIIAKIIFSGERGVCEGTAYLGENIHQGVDNNHQEIFIPSSYAGKTLDLSVRFWTYFKTAGGISELSYTLTEASVCYLDEKADDLYYTFRVCLDVIDTLDNASYDGIELELALDRAYRIVDWTADDIYPSLYAALDSLKTDLARLQKFSKIYISAVAQTHIDVAWLWRIKHTKEKAARSFATALRWMELYDDFIFMQSQPQLFEYIKTDYPALYAQIKERVKENRFEIDGGMWVEPDCNLPSGESLVRQILYGKKFIREEFGHESDYLWLPDVFGYSWSLPQILKKSGIHTFMTTKMNWNQYNKMPSNTFFWRGIDGTEILTHFVTAPFGASAETADQLWKNYPDKEVNNHLLMMYGHGDGGGGADRYMIEGLKRLKTMPGVAHIKSEKAGTYFKRLNETIHKDDKYVRTWDGELYLELHRGTLTSQAAIKRYNRKMEFLYRDTEILSVINSLENQDFRLYNQSELEKGWKIILLNQFHDIIPGSSIHAVYTDAIADYQKAETLAKKNITAALEGVMTNDGHYSVFNNAAWKQNGLVTVETNEIGSFYRNNEHLESQKTENGYLVYIPNLDPLSFTAIEMKSGKQEDASVFAISPQLIETPFYRITLNKYGQFTGIFDKTENREILSHCGNVFQSFEDRPLNWENWDIDIFYQDKMSEVKNLTSFTVTENGPLRSKVHLEYRYLHSVISQEICLYAYDKRIDFVTVVDWHEHRQLLKVAFPVDIRATKAVYDIQFGNAERTTHRNTSWDFAQFEVVGHKWADLAEGGYGVTLMNDCKYGYDIKDGLMRLSLIKSGINPDPDADQGHHAFTYSLYPHKGSFREGNTEQEAWNLNNPLYATKGWAETRRLFIVDTDHVEIDAVKKAENEDAVILRLHDYKGMKSHCTIRSDYAVHSFIECDLTERETGEKVFSDKIETTINPYEIKTFKIYF